MVVFIFLVVQGLHKGEGVGTVWSLQPFISENAHRIPIITGATIVCFSFLGFDEVPHFRRHTGRRTRDPESHLPDGGLWWRYLYRGVVFVQLFFPDISRFKYRTPHCLKLHSTSAELFQSIFLCTTFVNTLASGLASQASVSRLLYVMGRDNVFPERVFGDAIRNGGLGTERHYGRDCRDVGAVLRFSYRHSVN